MIKFIEQLKENSYNLDRLRILQNLGEKACLLIRKC